MASKKTMADIVREYEREKINARRPGLVYWDAMHELRRGSRTSRHTSSRDYIRARQPKPDTEER